MSKLPFLLLPILLLTPQPAVAQRFTPVAPPALTGSNPNSGLNDVAYNDKQRVYLQVWGHPVVYGRFITEQGAPIGDGPFVIAQQSASDAMPRVEYSSGSTDDVFAVRFTSELDRGQYLFLRLVRYTPSGPQMGPIQLVMGGNNEIARAGGLAFNPSKRQFLLTWESPSLGWEVFGQLWQLSGASTAPSASPATAILNISEMNYAQGTPNVAYDWEHDKYLVVFRGEHPNSEFIKGSWARLVSFDANNGVSKSGVIELSSGYGEPAEQNVVYMPEADSFLTFWTDITSVRDLTGRIVNASGTPTTGAFPILATSGNEGAADAAYSSSTGTVLVAAMREQTKYVQGIELSGAGSVIEYFQATTAIPSGGLESLFPHVAAGQSGRFGIGYVNNYQLVWFDLLQGVNNGGGTNQPAPCSYSLSSSSQTFDANGGVGGFTLTTGGSCTWSATSSADWLSPGSSSVNGTGARIISYAVATNSTTAARTAAISVGGQTFTVTQQGLVVDTFTSRERGRADINRDGYYDLVWRNAATGQLAVWMLQGTAVKVEAGLSYTMPDLNWEVAGMADFNRDGRPDILWRNRVYGYLGVWFMDGLTVYSVVSLSVPQVADIGWKIAAVGDFNLDGNPDIIWQHDTGPVVLWGMDGVRVVYSVQLNGDPVTGGDASWRVVAAADMNADGHTDLLWRHKEGWLAVWLMVRSDVWQVRSLNPGSEPDTSWRIVGTMDANRDGRSDLVWQRTDGSVLLWAMDGLTRAYTADVGSGSLTGPNWKVVGPK